MSHKIPDYRIRVNGSDISPTINGRLISLGITDNRGNEADQIDLTLTDHDGRLAIPPKGARVDVWIGFKNQQLVSKGSFTVDEINHSGPPDIITIRGRSADFRGSLKVKREQSWHETTLGDIITTLASRNQLQAAVSDALAGVTVDHIDQTGESDISFLTRLAKQHDAIAAIKAGKMLLTPAGTAKTVSGSEIPAITINRKQGDKHTYQLNDRDSEYSGVIANWNATKHARREEVVVGSKDTPKKLRHTYRSATEAREAANAEWARINRQTANFTLDLAEGNPSLYPETPVKATGWKAEIENTDWLLTRVVHDLNDSGYTSRLEMETKVDP